MSDDIKLTDRQIEFLAQRVLMRSPFLRLSGKFQGRAGAAISAMTSRLLALDMIESRAISRLTRAGLDALERGLGRILPEVDDIEGTLEHAINAAIAKQRARIDDEEGLEHKATRERLEAMVEEEAKRKAAIPTKLLELASDAGVMVGVIGVDHIGTEHERLAALWNAIVKADASL